MFFSIYIGRKMATYDIGDMRVQYLEKKDAFTEDQLVSDEPIGQFNAWFKEAKDCKDIIEPNAMCLATANKDGIPTARMVLLKGYGPDGFKFFTNYESKKGKDLEENPRGSLLFYWPPFNRQIRIEGKVERVAESESIEYFNRRPLSSRVSAIVSQQSRPVPSRDYLINAANELLSGNKVERPEFWGGFILRPEKMEFWQGQTDRLHDRIVFTKDNDKWKIERLAP